MAVMLGGLLLSALVFSGGEDRLLEYLERHARDDGGYGFADQPDSHLEPTFAVIGCTKILGKEPPRRAALRKYITGLDNYFGTPRNLYAHRQVQALEWLGEPVEVRRSIRDAKRYLPSVAWSPRVHRMGPAVLQVESRDLWCRSLLGHSLDGVREDWKKYLADRRRKNGSYNNTPAEDGSDGHVMNTLWALEAASLLRVSFEPVGETVSWLRKCQLENGGFTYQPDAPIASIDDVAYTWAAVRALKRLGGEPERRAACIAYLLSLRNADGGFGDRPGLPSRPMATFRALDALATLNALEALRNDDRALTPRADEAIPPDLKAWTIQIQAPGLGSPKEAVQVAKALRIHLWGAKNTTPEWIARMQKIADDEKVQVTVFIANEHYGEHVSLPGLGIYNHIVDPIAPAGTDFSFWKKQLPWEEYRKASIDPLLKAGGSLNWQFNENEEFTRVLLDDSVQRDGYTNIMDFHWNERSLADAHPFLYRYRHQLTFVAQQDAHYDSWRDCDNLTGYRTVFLGKDPSWASWREALRKNWVVAVRNDPVTKFRTRMHGGAPGVQKYVRSREADWKWWGEDPKDVLRPRVAVHFIYPEEDLEEGRPEEGVAIRVRAWEKRVTLDGLIVDGKPVKTERVKATKKISAYARVVLARPAPGAHSVTVIAKDGQSGEEVREKWGFYYSR